VADSEEGFLNYLRALQHEQNYDGVPEKPAAEHK
jgi:hypothetical protein